MPGLRASEPVPFALAAHVSGGAWLPDQALLPPSRGGGRAVNTCERVTADARILVTMWDRGLPVVTTARRRGAGKGSSLPCAEDELHREKQGSAQPLEAG